MSRASTQRDTRVGNLATPERQVVPDGIVAHRQAVRAKGGLVALGAAVTLCVVGLLLLVLPGAPSGLLGFVLIVVALPTLPLFGVPAAGGITRYAAGFITSAALWWAVGHYASRRATSRAIAGWPEWRREFRPLAIGVALGALLSLAFAAVVLGVL